MAQGDTPITVVGNLVADPELRFIPSGAAVANFRIASTPRTYNRETNQFEDGEALFFNAAATDLDTAELGRVMVGALPDNVHLTADGGYALVANEGEPSNELNAEGTDYVTDPEGSVSVIKLPKAVEAPTQADARIAGFTAFDGQPLPEGVRVFGPAGHDSKPSIDFEPEYITSQDGKAFVSLQEANAIGVIDIESATVEKTLPAHIADHSQVPLDPSNCLLYTSPSPRD